MRLNDASDEHSHVIYAVGHANEAHTFGLKAIARLREWEHAAEFETLYAAAFKIFEEKERGIRS